MSRHELILHIEYLWQVPSEGDLSPGSCWPLSKELAPARVAGLSSDAPSQAGRGAMSSLMGQPRALGTIRKGKAGEKSRNCRALVSLCPWVGAHCCLSPALPVSTELSQGCARGCDLCSEFNGCLRCSPKLFILLERNDIRQIGICLPSCPLGYFGLRNTDMNKCISEYQWCLRAAGRSWCSSPLPVHGHEAAL